MIVAFDTNVLVSAVATRGLCADIVNAALAGHQLVIGQTVLTELRQVLKDKLRLPDAIIDEIEAFWRANADLVRDAPPLAIEGLDRADIAVLAEAVAGKAAVLVTGDQALLAIKAHRSLQILSPRGFWELLRAG